MKSAQKGAAALILAGGKSTRLFPFNKVLSDLTGSGRTLIQQTRDRLNMFPKGSLYALTTRDMAAPVRRQLGLAASHVLIDPVRRGTWPAILWAMAQLRNLGPETVLAVLPGDHAIQQDSAYRKAITKAMDLAREKPAVVMIGITPSSDPDAWQGFGCFQAGEGRPIVQFQEKPHPDEVLRMVTQGDWYWNSGMFFFRMAVAEEALKRYQPEMYRIYTAMMDAFARKNGDEAALLFERFPDKIVHPLEPGRLVDNTIDYALMTPLARCPQRGLEARAIVHVGFGWTDLGQWSALKGIVKADRHGNIRIGDVKVGPGVTQSILVADRGHQLQISRANGLIVALSGRRALVLPMADAAHVKEIVKSARPDEDIIGPSSCKSAFCWQTRGKMAVLSNQTKESL